MKLPAQTSVAGARLGFVWLWILGVLCINTHVHQPSHTHTSPLPHLSNLITPLKKNLNVPSDFNIWTVRRYEEPNRCRAGHTKYFGISYFPLYSNKVSYHKKNKITSSFVGIKKKEWSNFYVAFVNIVAQLCKLQHGWKETCLIVSCSHPPSLSLQFMWQCHLQKKSPKTCW